jgi:hypothetical protein
MKTRRVKQRGGMNCTRGGCKRLTNRVKSFFYPKPEFPEYEKPTLYNEPPGIEFYDKMVEYLSRIERRNKEEEMEEACQKVIAFILLTDAGSDIINILKRFSSNPPRTLIIELREFLQEIIDESQQEEQDIFFIGYKWTPQVLAKLRARNLASVKASSRGGYEAIVPGGPGPAGIVSEFGGGPQETSSRNLTLRGTRKHSITAEQQLRRLKEVGTSEHGSGVGDGTKIIGINLPAIKKGKENFFVRNWKLHLNKNERSV